LHVNILGRCIICREITGAISGIVYVLGPFGLKFVAYGLLNCAGGSNSSGKNYEEPLSLPLEQPNDLRQILKQLSCRTMYGRIENISTRFYSLSTFLNLVPDIKGGT
jgi:hypothetical protein